MFSKVFWWYLGKADNIQEFVNIEPSKTFNLRHIMGDRWNETAFIEIYSLRDDRSEGAQEVS